MLAEYSSLWNGFCWKQLPLFSFSTIQVTYTLKSLQNPRKPYLLTLYNYIRELIYIDCLSQAIGSL